MEKVKEGSTFTHSQTMAMTSDQQMDAAVVDQWANMLNARQRAIESSRRRFPSVYVFPSQFYADLTRYGL